MSVKCGNCKGRHPTIHDVRGCYHNAMLDQPDPSAVPPPQSEPEKVIPPSDKQMDFCQSLLEERIWPDVYTRDELAAMSRSQVSALITGLKAAEVKPQELQFPEGRYALRLNDNNEDDIEFFEVDLWNGRIGVRRLIGAPGDFAKYPVYGGQARRIIAEIERDPKEAMLLFGEKTECCGKCGSPLTRPESRQARIGPKCAKKVNW